MSAGAGPVVGLLTWNLHGRGGQFDAALAAAHVRAADADVLVLQEVQRSHAAALADALGWRQRWSWKHWAVVHPPEGLAVLTRLPLLGLRTCRISAPAPPWSYRRRIAQVATVDVAGSPLVVAGCHLASDDEEARLAQVERVLAVVEEAGGGADRATGGVPTVVAGDLNARPGSPVLARFAAVGLRDAWAEASGGASEADGATNWAGGRGTKPPTQRLDYVLAGDGLEVVAAAVPRPDDPGFDELRRLSDHLPVAVRLRLVAPR